MRFHRLKRRERGAILILTCIAMITLMAFTSAAIDIGQRNRQLAKAQHAIDAAVLTAAQYLSGHDGDYAGAAARVKDIISQNLGIATATWIGCDDPDHLALTAPFDTTCISFRRVTSTTSSSVKHDIRVQLPSLTMNTVFGSVLGVDTIDLAAVASSNGTNCATATTASPGCGPGTSVPDTTTTPASPTTTSLSGYCGSYSMLNFAVDESLWSLCEQFHPGENIQKWRQDVCTSDRVEAPLGDTTVVWELTEMHRFIWWWNNLCSTYGSATNREKWLSTVCVGDESVIFGDWYLWRECHERRPSLQDWDEHWPSTTTPTSTPDTTTTTQGPFPPTTVPTSIDLSS